MKIGTKVRRVVWFCKCKQAMGLGCMKKPRTVMDGMGTKGFGDVLVNAR